MTPASNKAPAGSTTKQQPRTGKKTRVKSGCVTCKSRRVKCDEGRPACQRCLDTGRVCEGYGIWGGGGNAYGSDMRKFMNKVSHAYEPFSRERCLVSPSRADSEEGTCFDFFRNRTSVKLPGSFGSEFWETVIFQVSSLEPAVLHAATALASLQRSIELEESVKSINGILSIPTIADSAVKWNRFALQQYNKAIKSLQAHFSAQNHRSIQIALITCMIFTCIDILRGEYITAHKHVESGIGLLCSLHLTGASNLLDAIPHMDFVDSSLIEAFSRLNMQSILFGFPSSYFSGEEWEAGPSHLFNIPGTFNTLHDARQSLDGLFLAVMQLSKTIALRNSASPSTPSFTITPSDEAAQIRRALAAWLHTYTTSLPIFTPKLSPRSSLGVGLLRIYHLMISTLLSTCADQLDGSDEMVYDAYTPDFASIVAQARAHFAHSDMLIAKYRPSIMNVSTPEGPKLMADLGIIAPLFYAALKCRDPWVRREAISCLHVAPHRESIWDGELAAAAARKIMEIEEQGFYDSVVDECQSGEVPTLPVTHRFHEVQVVLQNRCKGIGKVVCRRKRGKSEPVVMGEEEGWEVVEGVFGLPGKQAEEKTETGSAGMLLFAHGQWFETSPQVSKEECSSSETGSV